MIEIHKCYSINIIYIKNIQKFIDLFTFFLKVKPTKLYLLNMAILSSVRVHLKILGIVALSDKDLPSTLQLYKSVINSAYNLFWHFSLATYSLTVICFMLFEAATFLEYAETTFYCSVTFLHFVSHIILFKTRFELNDLFKDSDQMVQKSIYSSFIF